jgi:hypothetical protein
MSVSWPFEGYVITTIVALGLVAMIAHCAFEVFRAIRYGRVRGRFYEPLVTRHEQPGSFWSLVIQYIVICVLFGGTAIFIAVEILSRYF